MSGLEVRDMEFVEKGHLSHPARWSPVNLLGEDAPKMNGNVTVDGTIMRARADLAALNRMAVRHQLDGCSLAAHTERIHEPMRLACARRWRSRSSRTWRADGVAA